MKLGGLTPAGVEKTDSQTYKSMLGCVPSLPLPLSQNQIKSNQDLTKIKEKKDNYCDLLLLLLLINSLHPFKVVDCANFWTEINVWCA